MDTPWRILVVPFATEVDEGGRLKDPWQGVLSRMVAASIAEKLDLSPKADARFFPFIATREAKRTWAIPRRAWTERDAAEFRTDDYDADVLVFGSFRATDTYCLVVNAFDVRGHFIRFRKQIEGPVDSFLDSFERLLLDMLDALTALPADVNVRREIGRFGTRDWRAWRAYVSGKSNAMSYALGLSIVGHGRPLDPLVEAFTRDPTFQEAAEQLAMLALEVVLGDKGDAVPALDALRKAIRTFPDNFKLYGALGFCYRKLDYRQDAQLAWERCLELDHEQQSAAETLFQLGCLFEDGGDFPAACLRYRAAIGEREDHCDAHDRLAFSLANLGDLDGAIQHWERVLELDPDRSATYGHLGWAFQENGRADDARQTYEKGLTDARPAWSVYFHYATFLVRNEEPNQALGVLERAQETLGEAAWIHERMGTAYLVLGDAQHARRHLKQAVRLDPEGDFGKSAAKALVRIGRLGDGIRQVLSRIGRAFGRLRPAHRK